MKKFISIIIVGILVLSGLGTAAFSTNISFKSTMILKHETTSVLFSSHPTQLEKDGFVEIKMSGATTHFAVAKDQALGPGGRNRRRYR